MRWITFVIMMGAFAGMTAGAYAASVAGWGLPGLLDKPVSLNKGNTRNGSVHGRRHGALIYFGSRRHYGGGYRGGK